MAVTSVNVGSAANDGTGDTLRGAFEKVNANESYLEGLAQQGVDDAAAAQATADAAIPATEKGAAGGVATLDANATPSQAPQFITRYTSVASRYFTPLLVPNTGTPPTFALLEGRLYPVPFMVGANATFAGVGIWVSATAPGSVIHLGLYDSDAFGRPGELVADFGTVDSATSTGSKEIVISQPLTGGRLYHLVALAVGGQPSVRGTAPLFGHYTVENDSNASGMRTAAVSSAGNTSLGATFPALSTGVSFCPAIWMVT